MNFTIYKGWSGENMVHIGENNKNNDENTKNNLKNIRGGPWYLKMGFHFGTGPRNDFETIFVSISILLW